MCFSNRFLTMLLGVLLIGCNNKDNIRLDGGSLISVDDSSLKRYHESEVFSDNKNLARIIIDTSLLNGVYYKNYENGSLSQEHMFVDGMQHGFSRTYYKSGSREWVGNWRSSREHGLWMKYYEDGSLMSKGKYFDGNIDGVVIDYYSNGQIKSEKRFTKGDLHGEAKGYYDDGLIEYVVMWRRGEIIKETRWDTNGYIVSSN